MSSKKAKNQQSAAAGAEAFATDEAVLRVTDGNADAQGAADSLHSDLAYWQTRAFDLQNEITALEDQRKQRQMQSLDKMKAALRAAQEQLKAELAQNMELSTQVSDLTLQQSEQQQVLESSSQELTSIRQKLKQYRDTTQQKDDQSKMTKAIANVQQADNLTELTMLALKITEETKRADVTSMQLNGDGAAQQ